MTRSPHPFRRSNAFVSGKKSRLLAVLVASLTLFLAGCATYSSPGHPLANSPAAARDRGSLSTSSFGSRSSFLYWSKGSSSILCCVYNAAAQDEHPEQYHGNTRLEITWTLIPALTFLVVFGLTIRTIETARPDAAPAEGTPIIVAVINGGGKFSTTKVK